MNTSRNRESDVIPAEEAGTLPGLFRVRVARTPDKTAYRQYDSTKEQWVDFTWKETAGLVGLWQRNLATEGLAAGERVAVQLRNSLEWVCFEQAALSLGLVVVPLYPNDNPENVAYILGDSGSRLLLVGTQEQWRALAVHRGQFPQLSHVLCVERSHGPSAPEGIPFSYVADWLTQGGQLPAKHAGEPNELATIVYTSGTTGRPKGVMLSHRNILWNAEAQLKTVLTYPDDIFLSFLPLSHTFERTVGYCFPMMAGSCVVYARSIQDLREDLLTIRPTVLISVPRIYEKAFARIQQKLAEEGRLAQTLFRWAVDIGWSRFLADQHREDPPGLKDRLLWVVLKRLVADKVLSRLGGRIRIAISGAAALQDSVARCFVGLGLTLLEGYGLTEAAPTVAGNRIADSVPGSAGIPLPGVETRIAANGELLVRSPGVMLGYWGRPEDTGKAVDQFGWLHTGDLAEMRSGRIYIRGRLKDILVMSTGEKVAAGELQRAIVRDPLFDQALVVAEGEPYVSVLLVLEQRAWSAFAERLQLDPDDPDALQAESVKRAVIERIAGLLHQFPAPSQVHAVWLMQEPWSVENGLLTPTMKVRRGPVEQRFAKQIRGLYAGHELAG